MFVDGLTATAIGQPTGNLYIGAVGTVQSISMNMAIVAFPTCLVEAHVSAFLPVRKGRTYLKQWRKETWHNAMSCVSEAAQQRSLMAGAQDAMAEARQRLAADKLDNFERGAEHYRAIWHGTLTFARADRRHAKAAGHKLP
jgi:hypothetical protein